MTCSPNLATFFVEGFVFFTLSFAAYHQSTATGSPSLSSSCGLIFSWPGTSRMRVWGQRFMTWATPRRAAAFMLGRGVRALAQRAAFALIWMAHIGVDRALGYGLKYPT